MTDTHHHIKNIGERFEDRFPDMAGWTVFTPDGKDVDLSLAVSSHIKQELRTFLELEIARLEREAQMTPFVHGTATIEYTEGVKCGYQDHIQSQIDHYKKLLKEI